MKFPGPKGSIVGLDIGPREIRLIAGEVEASVSTPEGAILDGVIVEKDKVAEAIKDLFRSKDIEAKNVVTAVSGKGVVLHLTEVPSMGPEGIKDAIKDEVSKYMVFAGSEVIVDFHSLQEVSQEGRKNLKILAAAAKKEIVDSYVEAVKLAGLNLVAIDVGSLAMARAIYAKESISSGVVLLAAVEPEGATIFVFKDGNIYYVHKVEVGSQLSSEIESILGYCRSEFGEEAEVRKIISTDLEGISIAKGLASRDVAEFPVRINLLPLEEIRIKEFNQQALLFGKVLVGVAALLILASFILRFQTWLTFREIASIQDELKKPNPVLERLIGTEKMAKIYSLEMREQGKIVERAKGEDWGEVLGEIKRIMPKRARLLSIRSDEKDIVTFRGEAAGQDAVFDFVKSLKGSKRFKDIKLEEAKDKETEEGVYSFFVIKCELKL